MKDKDAAEARGLRQEDSQHSVEVEDSIVISNWGQGRGGLSMAPTVSAEVEGAACDSAEEVTGLARVDTRKEGKEGP